MTQRARITTFADLAASAALTTAALMAPTAALSQDETLQKQGNPALLAPMRPVNEKTIEQVFNDRWEASTDDFVLGEDGSLVASDRARDRMDSQTKQNQIGNIALGYAADEDDSSVTDFGTQPNGMLGQIGNNQSRESLDAESQKCGPSPLNQAEIKALVERVAERHGVDKAFANAIAWAESNFDQNRNSPKGARGPMQLMPQTAERFDVKDVCDPEDNINGGIRYLKLLLEEFQNPLLAAAAYNAGEERIYEYGGIPPFRETVAYVAKVVNYQLGIPMPRKKRAPAVASRSNNLMTDSREVGVITGKQPGKFVGGVMHF